MHMSWRTSGSRVTVRSRISLYLMDGNQPLAHEKACSTENFFPPAHIGILDGVLPYLSAIASWKALLCRVKLCSFE